jgi:hypothetical protein
MMVAAVGPSPLRGATARYPAEFGAAGPPVKQVAEIARSYKDGKPGGFGDHPAANPGWGLRK